MAFLYFGSRGLRIENIETTLGLFPGSIHHSLCDFESLLNPAGYFDLEFYHASFVDFLCDKSRSRDWYIDLKAEAGRFCHLDLAAFQRPQTLIDKESWFQCFCEALAHCQPVPVDIIKTLDTSWNDILSYPIGFDFLKSLGKNAGPCYVDLFRAYRGKGSTDTERTKLCQSLNDSMTKLLRPFLLIYKSNSHLYALFLLSIFKFDPYFDYHQDLDGNAPDWVCGTLKQTLIQAVAHSTRLSTLDNRALKIMKPNDRPGIVLVRSLLASFYGQGASTRGSARSPHPSLDDDEALRSAIKSLLEHFSTIDRRLRRTRGAECYQGHFGSRVDNGKLLSTIRIPYVHAYVEVVGGVSVKKIRATL
ncbi:hypothetical protein BJ165DRAFT_1406081 [Panaeolus papilionaceus]|nr:hypothetical protein BJ165DRAFT_1406081 [Panaeolus papilionaceus]